MSRRREASEFRRREASESERRPAPSMVILDSEGTRRLSEDNLLYDFVSRGREGGLFSDCCNVNVLEC